MYQMTDDYHDIQLQLSEDDEPTQSKKAPKKKYTMSDKAKATRIENLRLGREKRNAQIKQEKQGQVVDESDYTESESDNDIPFVPPVLQRTKAHRSLPKYVIQESPRKAPKVNKKEVELQQNVKRLENMVEKLIKQKSKRRVTQKTVIVPPQQAAPVERKVNPQQEKSKDFLLNLF